MGVGVAPQSGPLSIKERRRLNPSGPSKAILRLAVRALPPAHRNRYALEFYAEIHGMSRPRQLVYATSVLGHSTSLGMALVEPDLHRDATGKTDWRCRVRHHHYVRRNNPDAETPEAAFFLMCAWCGAVTDRYRSARVWQTAMS